MKSRIHCIEDNGATLNNQNDIRESAAKFFENLFTGGQADFCQEDLCHIEPLISQEEAESLYMVPSLAEVRDVVSGINSDSVAGPDGFSSLFFQHCWEIIKGDIYEAVLDFFNGRSLPRKFTTTTIVLIPKSESPKSWSEFRPIS